MIGDFLKPPTDNLYKFMTLSGLILLLLSVTYPTWLGIKLTLASYEAQRDSELLTADLKEFQRRNKDLDHEQGNLLADHKDLSQQLDALEKKVQESKVRPSRQSDQAVVDDLIRLDKLRSRLEEKGRKLQEASTAEHDVLHQLDKKHIELTFKAKVIRWQSGAGKFALAFAMLGAIGGTLVFTKGFNAWSLRVQVYQDAILKKQAEQNGKEADQELGQ